MEERGEEEKGRRSSEGKEWNGRGELEEESGIRREAGEDGGEGERRRGGGAEIG